MANNELSIQPSALSIFVAIFVAVIVVDRYYRWLTHNSIKHIRGPAVSSALLGNAHELGSQESVGDLEFKWLKEYGTAWRLRAPFGADVLMLADPKALQHVLQKSGYNYPKTVQNTVILKCITGKSILWAPEGDIHARHRKVMNPAFSAAQLRSFLPLFRRSANKLAQLWKDKLLSQSPKGRVIKVNEWLERTTLDVIGETAFDYDFGALDETDNEVSKAYHNMLADSQLQPSKAAVLFSALWTYLPSPLLSLIPHLPTRETNRFRTTLETINRVSNRLILEKSKDVAANDGSAKDVMSILVRANASENPRTRLTEEEMVSQMAAFTLAGHETTANTVTWLLWELTNHVGIQDQLRAEIAQKRQEIHERGDIDFTMDDLEAMPLLQAVVKETLRYHPIAYALFRTAARDDVIPLSQPVVTTSGEVVSEIPIGKGQVIWTSLAGYNRLPEVWGADAHEWNPMRWIDRDQEKEIKVGMVANLMSFSAGVRSCIGWRFAIIEIQALTVELVENFRFSHPHGKKLEILRAPTMAMSPYIKGRECEGFQMPLHVVPVDAAV